MSYRADYADGEPARAEVDVLPGITLLEFGAPWCPHCVGAQAMIEAAFAGHGDMHHLKIEDGPGRPLGRSFRVKLWPTLIVIRDGVELARVVRPTTSEAIVQAFAHV